MGITFLSLINIDIVVISNNFKVSKQITIHYAGIIIKNLFYLPVTFIIH